MVIATRMIDYRAVAIRFEAVKFVVGMCKYSWGGGETIFGSIWCFLEARPDDSITCISTLFTHYIVQHWFGFLIWNALNGCEIGAFWTQERENYWQKEPLAQIYHWKKFQLWSHGLTAEASFLMVYCPWQTYLVTWQETSSHSGKAKIVTNWQE